MLLAAFWPQFVATLFIIVCLLLIIVVLLQKGRGGGLGAAFGGGGSGAFGTRTGDVFTWVTIVLTALFLLMAIATILLYQKDPGTVAQPVITPPGKGIDGPTLVSISCGTQGHTIRYVINFGTEADDPTERSEAYSAGGITVLPGGTVKAIAYRPGWKPSPMAMQVYPPTPVATPVAFPVGMPILGDTEVTLSCATADAKIHYTLDGADPTEQSALYTDTLIVEPNQTVKAKAFKKGKPASETMDQWYPPVTAPETPPATRPAPATAPAPAPATAPVGG